ncbi:MAG: alpha-galactosidase [Kiritimatiellia bacterium]|jgi:alpha-galactosidase
MISTPLLSIAVDGSAEALWTLATADGALRIPVAAPVFEIDGQDVVAALSDVAAVPARGAPLPDGVREAAFRGTLRDCPDLALTLVLRVADDSPVVRFRYSLAPAEGSTTLHRLTKRHDRDAIAYAAADLSALPECTEVRFGEFDARCHAFRLSETRVGAKEFDNSLRLMGPILAACGPAHSAFLAYEHGSQAPDLFVGFDLAPSRRVTLRAVKGNYYRGRPLSATDPFETLWFDLAALSGGLDDLAAACRHFFLLRCSPNAASRRPWIFYNTWGCQERDKWWNHHAYLDTMNEERILADIDIAHAMGIDVFVIDTGWYEKTGDWRVSSKRFPRGLGPIRDKLDRYGMKLGLWFSPTEAAVTSDILARNRGNIVSFRGVESTPHRVWETEESQNLCLVSPYASDFADELIRLSRDLGVTYFKWDAIGQYGCDSDRHAHGGPSVPADERADCYAFEQVRYMARVVDRLCAACPEAIVDFDITERGRSVGLAFLAAGKYFAVNNGPYYPCFDVPYDWAAEAFWSNVFVYPGPARGWFVRAPLDADRWIPSVLFLAHYFADAPATSQRINFASAILGQNGIWGDLQAVPPEGVAFFADAFAAYKRVRDAITSASPVRTGRIGGSPEIHEKLDAQGRGAVCLFANERGGQTYVTEHATAPLLWTSENCTVTRDAKGRAILHARFDSPDAAIALFS